MTMTALPQREDRDQARGLRELIARRSTAPVSRASNCRTIAVTSGKGGVGKSVLALNLAVAFAQMSRRVCVLDANLGVGNIDLLSGLSGYWNLAHVVSGARQLQEVVLEGTEGWRLLPGASSLSDVVDCPPHVQAELLCQLADLEAEHDLILIDTGSGTHPLARQLAQTADEVLIVTTPEPTAIADAYATFKSLATTAGPELSVVVNQTDATEQVTRILERIDQTARSFLRNRVALGTGIPRDPLVPYSVAQRQPFVSLSPSGTASRTVKQLAERLAARQGLKRSTDGFFTRLWCRWRSSSAASDLSHSSATVAGSRESVRLRR